MILASFLQSGNLTYAKDGEEDTKNPLLFAGEHSHLHCLEARQKTQAQPAPAWDLALNWLELSGACTDCTSHTPSTSPFLIFH